AMTSASPPPSAGEQARIRGSTRPRARNAGRSWNVRPPSSDRHTSVLNCVSAHGAATYVASVPAQMLGIEARFCGSTFVGDATRIVALANVAVWSRLATIHARPL